MNVIGSKLPEPWFTRVLEGKTGVRRFRLCLTCGHIHTTIEIPISERTAGDGRADCCHIHTRTKSVFLGQVTPEQAADKLILTRGVLAALSMGAVWRRRGCKLNYKPERDKQKNYKLFDNPAHYRCVDKDKRPTRWTTIEVSSDGIIVRDITKCPNCGGRTRSYARLEGRLREFKEKFDVK